MAKRYGVNLTDEERERLKSLTRMGTAPVRMVRRAQTLLLGRGIAPTGADGPGMLGSKSIGRRPRWPGGRRATVAELATTPACREGTMDDAELRLIQPGMDVDDVNGEEIGTVAHVHWEEAAPLSEGVLEVKTGLLGLGKHLRIPMSAVEEVVVHSDPSTALPAGGGDVVLSKTRAEIEQSD